MSVAEKEQREIEKYGCTKAKVDRIQRQHGRAYRAFYSHRYMALKNNAEWNITFNDWWEVWYWSGRWKERGNKSGQYCMARLCNEGAFEIGNVHIISVETNNQNIRNMYRSGVFGDDVAGSKMTERDWDYIERLKARLP